jgi:hypothetical protein
VTHAAVAAAIDAWLAQEYRGRTVVALRRRPWEYATSAALELLTAVLDDGTERSFVLKHLGPEEFSEQVRRAKPSFVIDPQREIEVYRLLLAPLRVGPRLVGSRVAPNNGIYWLLVEYVDGHRLHEIGELSTWVAVARWLGSLHARLADVDRSMREQARLIQYDRAWYTVWLNRALRFFASDDPPRSRRRGNALRWLATRYDKVIDHLTSLPQTVIHGEFYPSNVLVPGSPEKPMVYPIDWETTAVGPGIIDLAALTSGDWDAQNRCDMIPPYLAGLGPHTDRTLDSVFEDLEYAHIHLAVQWLGWFGRRRPPANHAHDWLAEAVERAEALGL